MDQIVFIDTEIEALTGRILDIGAVREGEVNSGRIQPLS